MKNNRTLRLAMFAGLVTLIAACGGEKREAESHEENHPASPSTAQLAPGGRKIEIEMYSNEKGNYFEPKEVTAHTGDVLHFELKTGVHNVHFLADSNPGKTGLPPASDLLQIPGQELDVAVTMGAGSYYFQCDPHAALGMTGRLVVK